MKNSCFVAFLFLSATAANAQAMHQNYARQKYKGVPQPMPEQKLKTDSTRSKMPVIKPDTTIQEKMPVVKPPANIQSK